MTELTPGGRALATSIYGAATSFASHQSRFEVDAR